MNLSNVSLNDALGFFGVTSSTLAGQSYRSFSLATLQSGSFFPTVLALSALAISCQFAESILTSLVSKRVSPIAASASAYVAPDAKATFKTPGVASTFRAPDVNATFKPTAPAATVVVAPAARLKPIAQAATAPVSRRSKILWALAATIAAIVTPVLLAFKASLIAATLVSCAPTVAYGIIALAGSAAFSYSVYKLLKA